MNDSYSETDARIACADVIARFAHHVDHREFDKVVKLFDENGVFERHDLTARGHAELAALWADRPASVITRHLCCAPCFLDIGPDVVRTATNCTLYHLSHEGGGLPQIGHPTAIVTFYDEFGHGAAGWRLVHRRAVPVLVGKA